MSEVNVSLTTDYRHDCAFVPLPTTKNAVEEMNSPTSNSSSVNFDFETVVFALTYLPSPLPSKPSRNDVAKIESTILG